MITLPLFLAARSQSAESSSPVKRLNFEEEAERIIQLQRSQIQQLKQDLRLQESAFRLPSAATTTTTTNTTATNTNTNTTATRLPKL